MNSPVLSPSCVSRFLHAFVHIAAIDYLFSARRPAYIPNFVVTLVIDSIKTQLRRWLRSDFRKELIKGSEAEFDSTATVVSVRLMLGSITTLLGMAKRAVFRSVATVASLTMRSACFHPALKPEAAAALCHAASKAGSFNDSFFAASTDTAPQCRASTILSMKANNFQSAENLPGNVDEIRGVLTYLLSSHVRFLLNRNLLGQAHREVCSFLLGRLHLSTAGAVTK